MKKILNFIVLMLISIFCLTSCVGVVEKPNDPDNPNGNQGQDPIVDPDDDLITYSVQLYRNGSLWIPNIDICAIFQNDVSTTEVPIDDFYGTCEFKGDGDYNVHLSAVPEGYTYNPNENIVDPQHTDLIIDLYPIQSFDGGNGSDEYENAYDISRIGYYKVELDSVNDIKYFHFLPTQSGEYSIESIVDVYADEVDPNGIRYSGTEQYLGVGEEFLDGGVSLEGGFTTNFKFSITFDATELNVARPFSISAENKYNTYPCTVYFKIEYVDDYNKGPTFNPTVVEPKEASIDVTPTQTGTFHWLSDLNGGVLDVRNCKYNEDDGFWYYVDPQTGEEHVLVCLVDLINKSLPSFGGNFAEAIQRVPTYFCLVADDGTRLCYDYFLRSEGPLYNEDGSVFDYQGICYLDYANDDGMVKVTNELMEFFQLLSNNKEFFKDGEGWIETQTNSNGERISAGQEDQWLFACGYYE